MVKNIRLIEKRKNSGLTQVQVAKQIGVSEVCYQCYESGKRTPRVDTAIKIADALGVKDLRELFADQAELSPHGIIGTANEIVEGNVIEISEGDETVKPRLL